MGMCRRRGRLLRGRAGPHFRNEIDRMIEKLARPIAKPDILPRTSARRMVRFQYRLLSRCRVRHGRLGSRHGGGNAFLFFRRELENVIGEEFTMISVEAVKRWRCRTGKDPLVILLFE